jgi:hypothetical protein
MFSKLGERSLPSTSSSGASVVVQSSSSLSGILIYSTEHVYNQNEIVSHNVKNNANNIYTSIRGEAFDLTQIAATHNRIVSVVPILNMYGGTSSDNIFPVQVCLLYFLISSLSKLFFAG